MFVILYILGSFFGFNDNLNPPGTIRVGNYYVDKTETLNINWLEYLYYRSLVLDSTEYSKLLPPSKNIWYDNPNLRYRPLVYINRKQAEAYCMWRSDVVSERLGKRVKYVLPSADDWKKISDEIRKRDSKYYDKIIKRNTDKGGKPQKTSRKNDQGNLDTLFDNLLELTKDEGVVVGIHPDSTYLINAPAHNVGFRCIVKIDD